MRKIKISLVIFTVFVFTISSCKTKSLSVHVLKPAEIFVPGKIKTIAVVNRSLPTKGDGSRIVNVLEGIVSGEGIFIDRNASERVISGVAEGLINSPRFSVTVPTGLDIRGTGTAQFPEPLSWKEIENICNEFSADALVLLETFDSNIRRKYNTRERTRKEDDKEIKYTEHMATIDIGISAGWRIYFPNERVIIDQNVFTDHRAWNEKGKSKSEAQNRLPKPSNAVEDAGFFAGKRYAERISPTWIWVPRRYYIKGNDDFKRARYKVQAKQWEEAADIWTKYTDYPDSKIAGYACYNMALASEVMGEFEIALNWAKKAYSDYQLKPALEYINIIEGRIRDAEALDKQMND